MTARELSAIDAIALAADCNDIGTFLIDLLVGALGRVGFSSSIMRGPAREAHSASGGILRSQPSAPATQGNGGIMLPFPFRSFSPAI